MVPVDPELVKLLYKPSQWQVTRAKTEHDRRTIYLLAKRNLRLPFMDTFDAPALQSSCSRRESSTHAPQALELLNGQLSNDLARSFASRLREESGATCRKRRGPRLPAGPGPSTHGRGTRLVARVPPRPAAGGFRPRPLQPQRVPLCLVKLTLDRSRTAARPARAGSSSGTHSPVSAVWRWRRSCTTSSFARDRPRRSLAKPVHFPAKARSVIFLFMAGGPSHLETFDPKPLLNKLEGQRRPKEFGEAKYQLIQSNAKLLGTRRTFKKHGQSGIEVSDLFPHIASCIDDIAVIRSCHGDMVVHSAAQYELFTGRVVPGFPAWDRGSCTAWAPRATRCRPTW